MKKWIYVVLGAFILLLIMPVLVEHSETASDLSKSSGMSSVQQTVEAENSLAQKEAPDSEEISIRLDGPTELDLLRQRAMASFEPWSNNLRSDLHALHPADLLEFLDDDGLLEHDDARNLVGQIHGLCGVVLALLAATESSSESSLPYEASQVLDSPGSAWCSLLADDKTAGETRRKLTELVQVITTVDPVGMPRRVKAEAEIERIIASESSTLLELLRDEDALTVAMTVHELWKQRDANFLPDWTAMDSLSAVQQDQVFDAIYTTLECGQLGNCGLNSLSVSSLCLKPGFQCAGQSTLDGVLYQSLSPSQLDAFHTLVTTISRYRRR